MESRASRLHAAGEIHRFHRDVAELAERAGDATAALAAPPPPRDLRAATAALRAHDTMQNDLLAIDAQMQVGVWETVCILYVELKSSFGVLIGRCEWTNQPTRALVSITLNWKQTRTKATDGVDYKLKLGFLRKK